MASKCAALVQSGATNHGFADGNKRTTVILCHVMITKSGFRLEPTDEDESLDRAMEKLVLSVVEEHLPWDAIEEWFQRRLRRV